MRRTACVGILVAAGLLSGCGQKNEYAEPPPPAVTVAQPLLHTVTDYLEFTGTTVSSGRADVRARVSGVLESMHFEPGSVVEAGQLLFVIDPREYEADLQAAEAELAAARAQFEQAKIELKRAQKLFKERAGSEAQVVNWAVKKKQASAAMQQAQAKIDRAALSLEYTQVSAPIEGRLGRDRVDIGNLVGEGEATILTEVTDYEPMYVYFNLNERDLLDVLDRYRGKAGEKEMGGIDGQTLKDLVIPLYMGLANETGYPHEGRYDFGESSVDPDTGTMQLRGIFDNTGPPYALIPGLFTRIRLPLGQREDIPLVSERAVGSDQSGTYLLVVNSENRVERRGVETGQLIDGLLVIETGVRADDWIVVNGIQRARPGRVVAPERTEMAMLKTSAHSMKAGEPAGAASTEPAGE